MSRFQQELGSKIDALKKETAFDSTKELIDRFEGSHNRSASHREHDPNFHHPRDPFDLTNPFPAEGQPITPTMLHRRPSFGPHLEASANLASTNLDPFSGLSSQATLGHSKPSSVLIW